jgi:hypothetical protein
MDALVLGLIAGIFTAIPFLGPLLSAVPAVLLAFGEGGMTPLRVVLAYLGIQALEGNVITPFVMARGMKLHPVAVIFSMLLCVGCVRGAGRPGGGPAGGHREHPARRDLSKALSSHGHRRRLGSTVTEGSPRKSVGEEMNLQPFPKPYPTDRAPSSLCRANGATTLLPGATPQMNSAGPEGAQPGASIPSGRIQMSNI